jgi:hypothetical protein
MRNVVCAAAGAIANAASSVPSSAARRFILDIITDLPEIRVMGAGNVVQADSFAVTKTRRKSSGAKKT